MATVNEVWTGSNGTVWASPWIRGLPSGAVLDIQSNRGRIVAPTGVGQAVSAIYGRASDIDITLTLDIANPIVGGSFYLSWRMSSLEDAFSATPQNGYGLQFNIGDGSFDVFRVDNNSWTYLSNQDATLVAGTDVKIRLQVIGSNHKLRIWNDGSVEPPSWLVEATDSAYSRGYWGVGWDSTVANGATFIDDLTGTVTDEIPPQWKANGTLQEGTGTATVPWPTHYIGDIGLLLIESCGGEAATLTTANGFAAVTNSPQATGATTAGTRITAFWCRATTTSMASPITNDPGNHIDAFIMVIPGCIATGDPWDVTAGAVKASASTSMTLPGVTTTVDKCLVLHIAARDTDSAAAAGSSPSNGNLTELTELYDAGTISGNGGGIMVWSGVKATAGATGDTTATVASSINAYLTIALKPPTPTSASATPDDAAVSVSASNLGSHRSTRTNADVTATAYGLTVGGLPTGIPLDDAAVTVAANLLSASNRNLSLASSSVSAFGLTVGGVYGPQTGVTQPGGSTTINPGDAYQTKINTAGAGATLWWTTGTYNFSAVAELAPAANQTWVFQYGAVIDGGGVSEVAIGGTATNVTFQNMRVTNFDSPHDIGAVHCYDGTNWTFDHCQFDNNTKCGLHVTYGAEVRWCKFNDNGQAGIMCRGFEAPSTWTTGLWIHHNEISYNNPDNVEDGDWDAGGLKFFGTDGLLLEYNWAHHNVGPGLWLDIDNKNATIENNTCEDNANHGIFYEISFGATLIDSNICRRNGFGTFGVGGGGAGAPVNAAPAGIFISNSSGVVCSNNTVEDNYTGIILINVDRSAENPLYDLYDVQVLDNISTGNTSYAAGIMGEDIPLASLVDVDFQGNTYTGETGDSWHYGEPVNFAEWQAEGFDTSGIELTPDDAAVSVTANPLGSQRSVGHATVTTVANALTSTNLRSLDDAAVSAAAYLLSLNGRTPSLATVSTLANALIASIGVIPSTATATVAAFNLSAQVTSQITPDDAASVVTAFSLNSGNRTLLSASPIDWDGSSSWDDNNTEWDATNTVRAFNLTVSVTSQITPDDASVSVQAANLQSTREFAAATVSVASNNLSIGAQFALANVQAIANNIGISSPAFTTAEAVVTAYNLLPTFILGLASVSVSAYNLGTVVNNDIPLGNASSTVSGFDLSQSGRALETATVGATAQGLSVAASQTAANAATAAFDITGLRTAVLGLASVLVEAQGLTSQVPEGIALQSAQSSVEAFGLDNFLLASAGLATVLLTASNIGADNQAKGNSTTEVQAFAIGSARNTGIAITAAVSYALTAIREASNRTANVTASAFGLSIQLESQQGTVKTGNPYTNFKRGGRAFTSLASGKAIT